MSDADKQHKADIEFLARRPETKRLLLRVIQMAGIFARTTNGSDRRNLDFDEGRRSLGLDILEMFEAAAPQAPLPDIPASTLTQVLLEAARTSPEDQNAKRPRYDRTAELDEPEDEA